MEQFKGTTDTEGRALFPDRTHMFCPSAYWWTFAPDADATCTPISVLKGWEEQGFAAFSGTGIYRLDTRIAAEDNWILTIPEAHTAVTVRIDGREAGRRAWRPYRLCSTTLRKARTNLGAPSPTPRRTDIMTTRPIWAARWTSGLTAAPRLVPLTRES